MSSVEPALIGSLSEAAAATSAEPEPACDVTAPSCLRGAIDQYADYVIGLLLRLGVGRADVDDVAQEVYLAIHAQLGTLEARKSFKTWLCGVCRHKAADYRRKRVRREQLASTNPPEPPLEAETPDRLLVRQEAKNMLYRATSRLSDEQLEVFVLHVSDGLPMKDVASLIGCPLDTAYTRYRAGLQRVRAFFQRAERATREP